MKKSNPTPPTGKRKPKSPTLPKVLDKNPIVNSVVGHLNAFAADAQRTTAVNNSSSTLPYTSKGRAQFSASSSSDYFVFIGPTGASDTMTGAGQTGVLYNNNTNGTSQVYTSSATTNKWGYDLVYCAPDLTHYFPNVSTTAIGAVSGSGYVTHADGYAAEGTHREVSTGVRIHNRTSTLNRAPVAYIFYDIQHEIMTKATRQLQTWQSIKDYIIGHPHCITWDCMKDPVFEMSFIPIGADGQTKSGLLPFAPTGSEPIQYWAYNSYSDLPQGSACLAALGGPISYNPTTLRYEQTTSYGIYPNVYIIFPATSTAAQNIEINFITHAEYRSSDLERLDLLTHTQANPLVETAINMIHRHKHATMGKTMVHAIKPAIKSAIDKVSKLHTDKASMAVVTAAAALL